MKIKEKGTGAMVLGILAIIGGCSICGGFIFGVIAIVMGVNAKNSEDKITSKGKIGFICGIIGICLALIAVPIDIIVGGAIAPTLVKYHDKIESESTSEQEDESTTSENNSDLSPEELDAANAIEIFTAVQMGLSTLDGFDAAQSLEAEGGAQFFALDYEKMKEADNEFYNQIMDAMPNEYKVQENIAQSVNETGNFYVYVSSETNTVEIYISDEIDENYMIYPDNGDY